MRAGSTRVCHTWTDYHEAVGSPEAARGSSRHGHLAHCTTQAPLHASARPFTSCKARWGPLYSTWRLGRARPPAPRLRWTRTSVQALSSTKKQAGKPYTLCWCPPPFAALCRRPRLANGSCRHYSLAPPHHLHQHLLNPPHPPPHPAALACMAAWAPRRPWPATLVCKPCACSGRA